MCRKLWFIWSISCTWNAVVTPSDISMLTKVHFQLRERPRLWLDFPKVKRPTTGRRMRAGYAAIAFRAHLQLPKASYIRQRERRELSPATQHKFNILVEGSLAQTILHIGLTIETIKTTANLHVQIPEKTPWLCRKKQGPALRKRAMERAMVAWALTRLTLSE